MSPPPAPEREGEIFYTSGVVPPTSLRGVSGIVVDAHSGAPIEGAWVGWRELNHELLATLLDPATRARSPGGGVYTGPDGRFSLERLPDDHPPADLLRAAAAGRAPAAIRPGLSRELRIELHPAGSLAVRITAEDGEVVAPRLRVVACETDVDRSLVEQDRPDRGGTPPAFRFLRLPPGTYAVELDGVERGQARVEAGRESLLELTAPSRWPIVVALAGEPPPGLLVRELQLLRRSGASQTRLSLPLRSERVFAGSPRPGPYELVAVLGDGVSDRAVVGLGRIEGPGERRVALPAPLLVRLELEVDHPWVELYGLDGQHLFLGEAGKGIAVAPGRYALFRRPWPGRQVFLGELDLTGAPPVVRVAPPLVPARLAFALPEGLGPDEALRAELALIPELLSGELDRVEERLRQPELIRARDPSVDLGPVLPGRYLVRGTTDLGPFEATVELPGDAVINLR